MDDHTHSRKGSRNSGVKGPKYGLVVELRRQHPEWTLARIGEEVGVCRERVRQILKGAKTDTKGRRVLICKGCGKPWEIGTRNDGSKTNPQDRKYCSPECLTQAHNTQDRCDNCNRLFTLYRTQQRNWEKGHYQHHYCSNQCRVEGQSKFKSTILGRAPRGQAEWVDVACRKCKANIHIRKKALEHRVGSGPGRIFCNRVCFYAYFKAHPEERCHRKVGVK